ncbi:MAG TPA: MBOAT family O-acyltransferase [Ohtaekwangia sp.]
MLFNSLEFAVFLPAVFILYWFLFQNNIRWQNGFLVAASFLFYGWWDWRFLILLVCSSGVDFITGLLIHKSECNKRRKLLLGISIAINLSILGFFKYFNFFIDNFIAAFRLFGQEFNSYSLQIVLPVGVSFYTFQALSYTIDVYRGTLVPTKDPVAYFAFISFFPQLVAGPIERATKLLPQFYIKRQFDYAKAVDGLRQMLWGLFKKIVIADNCAHYANDIFDHYENYNGSTLLLGAFFFALQIYGDFSGYSDIAIGTARLFGFNLMRNFAYPYFSRDIAEFWRRWHISLSTWFRDYVYIPLGGSQGKMALKIRNTVIVFLLSGFWHGANWTFIAWGAFNAVLFIPLLVMGQNRNHLGKVASGRFVPGSSDVLKMAFTFVLTLIGWVFFRSRTIDQAIHILGNIFSAKIASAPTVFPGLIFVLILLLIVTEWIQRERQHGLDFSDVRISMPVRWSVYLFLVLVIFWFGGEQQEFIYFDF